ncbi:quinol:cytochrome c oxidoreductase iron-sulfur protein precursor [Archangium gephyra]|uniref:Molybdopterin oxidoreductase n=1 Tax=Archangium gephyra TaxID=48 RepID=A0AAC8TDA0_9BACT|nr:TAT-variant-translocated molybdopterin oxidoreductase [Archangium gephyra]AKJ01772.1 Molybdopterin oxidoreductase [Archangium gephyra]REG34582.1 quinol:cytochrome c oxidoreductase iron-sulfur protein precursor [Archangium gephyra]
MSETTPKYWQSLAARAGDPAVLERSRNEFAEELPVGVAAQPPDASSRRDFFKVMGLSAAAAMVACQRAPVQKAVPFLTKPDELTPGLSLWYASTCGACSAQCGVLLKTRDGRPIKVEGNAEHPVSRGGVCAVGQASVLSLYDANRSRWPSVGGTKATWASLDQAVTEGLRKVAEEGRAIRLVLPWVMGPTAEAAVARFLAAFPTARTVRYDATGELEAIAEAHRLTHGVRVVPDYRFDQAKIIASFGADFLGTWVSPVAFTRQYSTARDAAGTREMARHWQLEPLMTLTGASADKRVPVAASDMVPALAGLVKRLAQKAGRAVEGLSGVPVSRVDASVLNTLADELWAAKEKALVVCGGDEPVAQVLANLANELLGNAGTTVSVSGGLTLDAGAMGLGELLAELEAKQVGAVLFHGVNPAYTHPRGEALAELLKDVAVTVATSDRLDETASLVRFHAPDHTPLESWGDAEPRRGVLSLRQPVVSPLHETRGTVESLLKWAGVEQSHHDFLRARWEAEIFPRANVATGFQAFWDEAVRQGVAVVLPQPATTESPAFRPESVAAALAGTAAADEGLELVLYQKVGLRDGTLANNGWLQEMPDPISKATWGNYLCVAPATATKLGISDGQVVRVSTGGKTLAVPALVQPGTHPRALGLAMGYGRTKVGRIGNAVGENAFVLAPFNNGKVRHAALGVTLEVTPETRPLALSQTHASMEGRGLVREAELAAFLANPRAGNEQEGGHGGGHPLSIWSGHEYKGHKWALAVDLSACTGCSACVVSCQAENNIPIVGEDEALRQREMHWMRIDRYYEGEPDAPRVVHQPMMCQHCDNAPCETVCPVLATVHSTEGLNQQVYNRCVGTRYCANNCPTKVRRFNWFDYKHDEPLERLVLNPDVVVRTRGVMEKCSLCVQRIQEGKAEAKRDGRELRDGDIRTACQQSCPAQAIHFGDINDPNSDVAKLAKSGRAYRLLEEINIGPAVTYLTKIRNTGNGSAE